MAQLRISAWGIKNPIPVAILFIGLTIAGLLAYASLPIKQFPNISFPVAAVTVTENGAAPSEMETQITRKVEDAPCPGLHQEIDGLLRITRPYPLVQLRGGAEGRPLLLVAVVHQRPPATRPPSPSQANRNRPRPTRRRSPSSSPREAGS